MKKRINLFLVIFLANVTMAFGALEPLYQSTNDIMKMTQLLYYLENSNLSIKSLDLDNLTITMNVPGNKTCLISFERQMQEDDTIATAPIVIKSNNCK